MAYIQRVTVALNAEEVDRRRVDEFRRSLLNPHSESLAEEGIEEWARGLPEEDAEALVDGGDGKTVRWVPGKGWVGDGS